MIRQFNATILLLLLSSQLFCQHSFSLEEAKEYGLFHNQIIKKSSLDLKYAYKQLKETIATGLPQINSEVKWQQFLEVPTTLVPASQFTPGAPPDQYTETQFGIPHTTSANITASQIIFNGGYVVALKAAKSFIQFEEIRNSLTLNQISDSISTAYINSLIAKKNEQFLKHLVSVHQGLLDEVEIQYNLGFVEDIETDKMALTLSQMVMNYNQSVRQSDLSEAYLKLILGIELDENIFLKDSLHLLLETCVDISLEESNIQNTLEYQMAELNEKLKYWDVKRYQTHKLPSISAFASIGTSAMGVNFTPLDASTKWYPNELIGISMSIPIFDGLGGKSRIQKAQIEKEIASLEKENTKQNLQLAQLSAKSNYLFAKQSLDQEVNNLVLAKKIYQKTRLKYVEGIISSSELTRISSEYLEHQLNHSKQILNLLVSHLKYQRSIGK
jgi:outer membrane protein TolC